jgi:hypothetical protein
MKLAKNQIEVRRYKNWQKMHLMAAAGYNCPHYPAPLNKCDYEIVRVVRAGSDFKNLKDRRVMMSWGLNLPLEKAKKLKAFCTDVENWSPFAEMLLAVTI